MELTFENPITTPGDYLAQESNPLVHQSFTEQGKIYFLEEKFELALKYFNYSLELAVQTDSPEFFVKHYLECLLEALEMIGNFEPVISYCDRFIGLIEDEMTNEAEQTFYLALLYQKRGIVLIKSGKADLGKSNLENAVQIAENNNFPLLLSENILFLLNSGITPDQHKIVQEQVQAGYFVINSETVNKEIAMRNPEIN
ncbi:hypothetical protein [Chondrinema litorale]|uniref:hypothetical protein n=1 Tax=Chondrinema litorale TaxID=2994555 RepID=UPI0025427AA3|nr:hypothetical protein [Chondrinema litorale]UZR95672.1 hypothetical protein OQ292_07595 [Chondrinema litorale]